ncbi:MAG: hypothetical protein MZW92_62480 [Comamonadaceae bacterium]|nr:hypothetical protein [Comamonadaceae bacterium]
MTAINMAPGTAPKMGRKGVRESGRSVETGRWSMGGMRWLLIGLAALGTGAAHPQQAREAGRGPPEAVVLRVSGPIGPATADFI